MTNTYSGKQTKTKTTNSTSPCGCGGHGTVSSPECCGLTCFERPKYFCGHLLTDDDLSLEQRYTIEKNRLRNRELHGKGVVCGLRLSCDPNCCGHVLIGDGYAIDDCGNDLVVCSPYSFDVIGALPKPGAATVDCNDNEKRTVDCPDTQCLYIAACYYEDESDYTTPFVAGCNGTPGACEPTRVHERVRFQLMEELPEKHSYLDQVEARLRECWSPFTKGRFSEAIKGYYSQLQNAEGHSGNYDLFCQLVALFRQQLQKRPSLQNCSLEAQVAALLCQKDDKHDPAGERASFEKLLTYIHQYVYDCMLAQLAFECHSPCEPACVILGSVEVESGKIVRVCNCEREYVWSFANFLEVLFFTTLQGGACHPAKAGAGPRNDAPAGNAAPEANTGKDCCPGFTVDVGQFGALYEFDPRVREYSSQTFVTAIRALTNSFRQSYQFTQPGVMSTKLFENETIDRVQQFAQKMGIREVKQVVNALPPADFLTTFQTNTLFPMGSNLIAYTDSKGKIIAAAGLPGDNDATRTVPAPDNTLDLQKQVEELRASHAELSAKLSELQTAMKPPPVPPAAPPAPEGGNPEAPHGG